MAEIQRADSWARAALVLLAGGALVGVALMAAAGSFRSDLEAWIKQDVDVRLRIVVAIVMFLSTGPLLGIAAYAWRLGQRIVHARRYPLPGWHLLRNTPVITDHAAVRRGRLVQAYGGVVGLAGLLLAFFLWRVVFVLRP